MKLRTKYILFVIIIHSVALTLSYAVFSEDKFLFFLAEILVLISLGISYALYNELINPLKLLTRGASAIADKDFNIKILPTGKYEMDQLIDVYNKMMDQLRIERTQQEEQHFFLEKLIYTSPIGIIIQDFDEKIQKINPKALEMLNISEREAQFNWTELSMRPIFKEISQLKTGESKTVIFNGLHTYKIQKSHFIDRGFTRGFILIEELTLEILATEKKVYGKLIRMMAHEVNNTMGPVNSIIQSSLNHPSLWNNKETDNIRQALEIAMNRNNNLAAFVRNFADLVRLPLPVKKPIDINKLLRNTSKLFESSALGKQITIKYQIPGSPFIVDADEAQLEQVFVNVIKNSFDAIGENGVMEVVTDTDHKMIVIKDSGKGIDELTTEQMFTPFFSNKKDGQGIGLTLVKEILMNHGFQFSLKKGVGGMTEFRIGV